MGREGEPPAGSSPAPGWKASRPGHSPGAQRDGSCRACRRHRPTHAQHRLGRDLWGGGTVPQPRAQPPLGGCARAAKPRPWLWPGAAPQSWPSLGPGLRRWGEVAWRREEPGGVGVIYERGPLPARRPLLASHAVPNPLTSAQAPAAAAPPPGAPLLLGRGPSAAKSWHHPLKRPGHSGLRSSAWPGMSALEGRGPTTTTPRPSSPLGLPLPPLPFLPDSPRLLLSEQTP